MPVQAESTSAGSGSPGTPLATRGVARCRAAPGSKPPCIRRLQRRGGGADASRSGPARSEAMRHGMRPGPRAISQNPRSAGEACASFYCGLPRGANASPATSTLPQNSGAPGRPDARTSALERSVARGGPGRLGPVGIAVGALGRRDQTLADSLLARGLAGAPDGLAPFPARGLGGLLVVFPELHLTEHAFTLKALFQNSKGLVDVVIAYLNLQKLS